MKAHLTRRSHEGTGRTSAWNNNIFNSIARRSLGEAFNELTFGHRIQLSTYMNDLLPTARRRSTFGQPIRWEMLRMWTFVGGYKSYHLLL